MPYYNTTKLTGDQLVTEVANAKNQQAAVLMVFQHVTMWSPSLVHQELERLGKNWPLTSIRRAISDLTKEGHLVKVDGVYAEGLYGKPECMWRLSDNYFLAAGE